MRLIILTLLLSLSLTVSSQNQLVQFPDHLSKTSMAQLKSNDSLMFYQCHVVEAKTEITTTTGEKITGESKKISITDKFVVYNNNGIYTLKYYTSTLSNFPNRKFTYLKVREKEYWNFKLEKTMPINEHDIQIFAAIEKKAHTANEFELTIDKYNTNGLIIRNKKTMKHMVVEGDHLIKKNLDVFR